MSDRLPHFLGLGVQKGGTTSLQRLLEQHPNVFLPKSKELHFFSLHYAKGEGWYRSHFDAAGAKQICGEITPYYIFHPESHKRVSDLLPNARLIVLLRDPVERALSQYFHSRRLGLEPLELKEAFDAEETRLIGAKEILAQPDGRHKSHQEQSYLNRSRYEQQLPRWEQSFPPEQMLVLKSEELFRSTDSLWQRVINFLELPPCEQPILKEAANSGRGEASKVNAQFRANLLKRLEPTYEWIYHQYKITWRQNGE